jgi:hypothetical protein
MGAVQQAGVIGLGEALAAVLAVPAVQVGAVGQPGPPGCAGLGGDERGQRDALAAWAVTRTTGVRSWRSQVPPLGGLRPWPDSYSKQSQAPRSAVALFVTGQVSCFHAAMASSSRSAARRAGPARSTDPVQQHIQPGQRVVHPEPLVHQLADPGQRPALVLPLPGGRPASSTASSSRSCAGVSLHRAPPAPLKASACFPPVASPAATGSPTSAIPGSVSRPPGRSRRPRSAPPRPAAPARARPVLRRSARRHRGHLMVPA